MRVVFLTGIWPPDIGGPATHGPDFARFLRDRGHDVRVVTMADAEPAERPVPVHAISRGAPFVVRYPRVAVEAARLARHADVVYATATYAAAAAATLIARRPLVVKLVSDPAYERAIRYGRFVGTLEGFQAAASPSVRALKQLRTTSLLRASRVVVPSRYLAEIATGWGIPSKRVEVIVNPAPVVDAVLPVTLEPNTFVFVGRLTRQKGLAVLLQALARVPDARLVLIGDGPLRGDLERQTSALGVEQRARFLGALPRDEALAYLAGARAAILTSDWENLPHAVVESLAVGTPVVATAVGGVPEVVQDGENGLLVAAGDVSAVAAAMARVLDEPGLRDALADGAAKSVSSLSRDRVYARLETVLESAAA